MIEEVRVSHLFDKYGINYDNLDARQKEALCCNGDYQVMEKTLNLLFSLNISPKSIEKCPSILYLKPECIKSNYEFLSSQDINIDKIDSCLHVLSSEPSDLRYTYRYVEENYGIATFNKNVSILAISVDRIQEIEKLFSGVMSKSAILSAANTTLRIPEISSIVLVCQSAGIEITSSIFQKGDSEISKIIDICRKNNVEITGSAFRKSSVELQRIVDVCNEKNVPVISSAFLKDSVEVGNIIDTCRELGIEITGSVFRRDADEIRDIKKVCDKYAIPISGTVFLRTADDIEEIVKICNKYGVEIKADVFKKKAGEVEAVVKVCSKYGIEISSTLFKKSATSLEKSINYVQKYGREFLTPLIITTDSNHLKKVFPHLEEKGVLFAVIQSPAILTLKYDEILEREKFISELGEADVVNGRFNPVYGLSRKRYKEKIASKENNIERVGIK